MLGRPKGDSRPFWFSATPCSRLPGELPGTLSCCYPSRSQVLYLSLALCHHSSTGWTARNDTKASHSHHSSLYTGHVLFQCFVRCCTITHLPLIQTWPTLKVILSKDIWPFLFPLSFTSPSTWYICPLSAQNIHTVHTSYSTYQKCCSFINFTLNHYHTPALTTNILHPSSPDCV